MALRLRDRLAIGIPLLAVLLLLLSQCAVTTPQAQTEAVTVSFQDGRYPSETYAGTRDTYLREAVPATNYGTYGALLVDGDEDQDYGFDQRVGLLAWDVSAIPPGARVTAASISVRVSGTTLEPYQIYPLYQPWDEQQATWFRHGSGFWHAVGASGAFDAAAQTAGEMQSAHAGIQTFTLNAEGLAAVQRWVNDPASNHGLAVANRFNTDDLTFYSRETATAANRPRLTVTYEPPVPGSAPAAAAQNLQTAEDTDLSWQPEASDPDGDPLVYAITIPPQHGELRLTGAGAVYRPEPHYAGSDSFTYTLSDGQSVSAPAAVTLDVLSVDDAPQPAFTADVWTGSAPLEVTFTATLADREGDPAELSWDFGGDGLAGSEEVVSHTFTQPGVYPVTLTAAGGDSQAAVTRPVVVEEGNQPLPSVILFVGDGMGIPAVRAAGLYQSGWAGSLYFEGFPNRAMMETSAANTERTDSAAAGSAMATGFKTNNEAISVALPGDGSDRYTILEAARDMGRSTGLVTTVTVTDATPAAFGAHAANRSLVDEIAADLFNGSRPNLLISAGGEGLTPALAEAAGYTVVTDRAGWDALNPDAIEYLSAQFGSISLPYESRWTGDYPRLSEMTAFALDALEEDPDGFFLLVENEGVDRAEHMYDPDGTIQAVLELDRSVQVAVEWARTHPNTLIVVLADHETSGLEITRERGQGVIADIGWNVYGHTGNDVAVYALGPYASLFAGNIDNTDIPKFLQGGSFNHPPVVDAGPESLGVSGTSQPLVLSATVNDDGLPAPAQISFLWEQTGGPEGASFGTPDAGETVVEFPQIGLYTLRVTASDGLLRASDEVSVLVTPILRIFLPDLSRD